MNFNDIIKQIVDSINIRDINNREHFNFDYVNLNIYLKNKFKKNNLLFILKKNVYMINNFRIKILININITYSKKIMTNLQIRKLIINNCDITTSITYTSINFKINRIVKSHYIVIIFAYSIIIVLFKI